MKRVIDVLGASLGLILVSPILAVAAIAIRTCLGSPVLMRQVRIGLGDQPFRVMKFRTMTNDRGPDGQLLPDEVRLTRLGRFLRTWSIDELPQLWNVMVGQMSLVGPRPLPARYLPRYTSRQRLRHTIKPGITGLAQVKGRNDLAWDRKLELDVSYAQGFSLWLDVKILAMTVVKVVARSGVRPGGGDDVGEFWGTEGKPTAGPTSLPFEENEGLQGPAR